MPLQQYKKQEGQVEFDWSMYGFDGLLNVNAMPQSIGDNQVTIAQNFYGSQQGGLYLRKGIAARGSALGSPPAARVDGLARFEQQIVNGVVQNPTLVTTLAQSVGDFYVSTSSSDTAYTMTGGSNALGSGALPWSTVQIYDADHTLPVPASPTANAPTNGGSLTAGTYLVSQTWLNANGETLRSADLTVSGVPSSGQFTVTQATPPVGAVQWNVYLSTQGGNRATETLQNSSPLAVGTTTLVITAIGNHGSPPASNTAIAPSDVMVICTGVGGPYAWDGTSLYVPAAWNANCPAATACAVVNNILFFAVIPEQLNLVVGMALGHPETLATGAANNFSMTSNTSGLAVIGAGALASLVVGMTKGISLINGTGFSNFYQVDLPMQDGCAARRSIISFDGYCFFLGKDDIYLIDPSGNLSPIGQNVRPYVLNDPVFTNSWDVPMNGNRSISWAFYYNKRIYLWYDYNQSGKTNAGLVYDMNLGGWTTYLPAQPLNAGCLLNASTDGAPLAAIVGGGSAAQVYNFDVYNGTAQNVDDAGTAINAIFQTKYFKVGQPGTEKRLVRVYPEFFVETINAFVYAATDYGTSTLNKIVAGSPPATGGIWDTSNWDQATWGSGGLLTFIGAPTTRIDWDLTFEALAIGIQSNVVQAPFWVQGCTGRAIQQTSV